MAFAATFFLVADFFFAAGLVFAFDFVVAALDDGAFFLVLWKEGDPGAFFRFPALLVELDFVLRVAACFSSDSALRKQSMKNGVSGMICRVVVIENASLPL